MPSDPACPIVVAGDITIDRLTWTERRRNAFTDPDAPEENWRHYRHTRTILRPGGTLLLAEMLQSALGYAPVSYQFDRGALSTDQHLVSFVDLRKIEEKQPNKGEPAKFEIAELRGFDGPGKAPPHIDLQHQPYMLVIDDAGNGFRDDPGRWQPLLARGAPYWTVLKMSRPLARTSDGGLWNAIRPPPKDWVIDPERLVVIINADDLRHHGVQLTPGLSWERIAQDFVRNLGSVGKLGSLAVCRHLVVRFGCEAVIHYRGYANGRVETPILYFDPRHMEGMLKPAASGKPMIGLTVAFTAALAASLANSDPTTGDVFDQAIRRGLDASRALWRRGFRGDADGQPDYPCNEIFAVPEQPETITCVRIPHSRITRHDFSWRILEDLKGSAPELARRVAVFGPDVALAKVPLLQLGGLVTADRREIESLRAITNLLKEYRQNTGMTKPLSIAVFGPPGAGKGFAVEEIAAELGAGKSDFLEFNLSQFTHLTDLQAAFHLVRDRVLSGGTPFVFFDEFDVTFNNEPLGWLKYLLAPMQDGKFREHAALHPLGRAIFIFAGGTAASYGAFIRAMSPDADKEAQKRFVAAKGPDFVSRLRGHIDILGPSRIESTDPQDGPDDTFVIRRAILLRTRLERHAPDLFSAKGELAIDPGVLHAFLTIPKFHHGARSLQAIIEMSTLAGERRFTRSSLPHPAQLDLHVPARAFLQLVAAETLPDELREQLGMLMHERYRDLQRRKAGTDPAKRAELAQQESMQPWSRLREDLRESNRRQADDVARKLRQVHCYMAPLSEERDGRIHTLETGCIDTLAEMEHERWVSERLGAGWMPGPRDVPKFKTPFLAPWCDLDPDIAENDRNAVRGIPELLDAVGYGIYALDDAAPSATTASASRSTT